MVEIVGPGARTIQVRNVRAVDGRDTEAVAEELVEADLAATAVGAGVLPAVSEGLAEGISRRSARRPDSTLDVLLCENLLHASRRVRELLAAAVREPARGYLRERVGLVEAVISRMIPAPRPGESEDPLHVAAEDYNILPVDLRAFRGPIPAIDGLRPVEKFQAHEERKLYAHNCGHALAAYFGRREGCEYIWQVVEAPELRSRVERGLWEAGDALCRKHGFSREEHSCHLAQLLARFANRALGDTVARVGRDPVRKLGPTDRLVGAARLAEEYGSRPEVIAEGIAAAMEFTAPGDPSADELAHMLATGGPERVMAEVCGMTPGEDLWELVLAARRGARR